MSFISRQLVLNRITALFPESSERQAALASLDRYRASDGPVVEAVQLAILKLSDGKLWKIREWVQDARHDFRDVLYPAQKDQASWWAWIGHPQP